MNARSALSNGAPVETHRVQSLDRALDLLELLAASSDGLSLRDLAAHTALKPPTVHNLLRTLVARGYVAKRTGPVRYAVGPAVPELARRAVRDRLLAAAPDVLRRLAHAFPQARATLATLSSGELAMRLRIIPGQPDGLEHPTVGAMSPYASASAVAFQAFGDAEAVGEFRRRHPFWEQGALLWGTPEALEAALRAFREAGVVNLKLRGEDIRKLAAPILGPDGSFVGVLGLAMPDVEEGRDAARQLREAASSLNAGSHNETNGGG
jgi:IclR family acetate operon transcriptional repressor